MLESRRGLEVEPAPPPAAEPPPPTLWLLPLVPLLAPLLLPLPLPLPLAPLPPGPLAWLAAGMEAPSGVRR